MPSQYTPDKKTIGELLTITNPPLIVPPWQRNYSWTTREVETFWQDLKTFSESYPNDTIGDQEYFIGSVVMVDTQGGFLVLDGQQRLATSAMVISVARDSLAKVSQDAANRLSQRYLTDFDDTRNRQSFKITLNEYDREFFQREILEPKSAAPAHLEPQMDSHRLIRKARAFLASKGDKI